MKSRRSFLLGLVGVMGSFYPSPRAGMKPLIPGIWDGDIASLTDSQLDAMVAYLQKRARTI